MKCAIKKVKNNRPSSDMLNMGKYQTVDKFTRALTKTVSRAIEDLYIEKSSQLFGIIPFYIGSEVYEVAYNLAGDEHPDVIKSEITKAVKSFATTCCEQGILRKEVSLLDYLFAKATKVQIAEPKPPIAPKPHVEVEQLNVEEQKETTEKELSNMVVERLQQVKEDVSDKNSEE